MGRRDPPWPECGKGLLEGRGLAQGAEEELRPRSQDRHTVGASSPPTLRPSTSSSRVAEFWNLEFWTTRASLVSP